MCKKLIINAGIEKVIIRKSEDEYAVVPVSDWVKDEEATSGANGY